MKLIRRKLQTSAAMTLTEILLAMFFIAAAFIPVVGVLGSSMKATDKDDRTIKAVNICQQKLNQALQFPFGILEPGANQTRSYGTTSLETLYSSNDANKIVLTVGPEEIDGFKFKTVLTVTDRPGSFNVPMYDPFEKGKPGNENDPTKWGWTDEVIPYQGMYYQYTMTLTWKDKGSNLDKQYTLSSFKSKVRN
ncbi:MAG: hypothetical protein Kow0029_23100 [Candidatus Rifleibacteriota bacterium]